MEKKAQTFFSENHQPPAVRDRQHDALDREAAQSEAKALDEASRSDLDMHEVDQGGEQIDVEGCNLCRTINDVNLLMCTLWKEDSSGSFSSRSPSLFPSYLSYSSQHKLLNTVQGVLEDCCYAWVAKWIPCLLQEQNWTCSEAVELFKWVEIIPPRFDSFSLAATKSKSGKALAAVFHNTHPIRHAAVHRFRTSVTGIERMLQSALILAVTLKDKQLKCKLHLILRDVRATKQTMELRKNYLESQLDEELRDIQEQRTALDKKEQKAKLGMFQQDREDTAEISRWFENSIRNLTSIDEPSATSIEQDHTRNLDSKEACDDATAVGTLDKHRAEGIHHPTEKAGCGNIDSKPSKHSDGELSAAQCIPNNPRADDSQIATTEAGFGSTDIKPSNGGDGEPSAADSVEILEQRISVYSEQLEFSRCVVVQTPPFPPKEEEEEDEEEEIRRC